MSGGGAKRFVALPPETSSRKLLKPVNGSLPRFEQPEMALGHFVVHHFAESAAECHAPWRTDDRQSNVIGTQLLQDNSGFSELMSKKASGKFAA